MVKEVEMMTSQEKVKAIESWQNSNMHPLACVNCSRNMRPMINSCNEVVLICDYCGHIQTYVPEVVYKRYERITKKENE